MIPMCCSNHLNSPHPLCPTVGTVRKRDQNGNSANSAGPETPLMPRHISKLGKIWIKKLWVCSKCPYWVDMHAVIDLILKWDRVTGGVAILIPWFYLQRVLLAISQNQCGEVIRYRCFGWDHCTCNTCNSCHLSSASFHFTTKESFSKRTA